MGNLRAALVWFQTTNVEDGLRLANALGCLWLIRDYQSEGRRWLETLLRNEGGTVATRAKATVRASVLAKFQGDLNRMAELAPAAATLARTVGDKISLATPSFSSAMSWLMYKKIIYRRNVCMRRRYSSFGKLSRNRGIGPH